MFLYKFCVIIEVYWDENYFLIHGGNNGVSHERPMINRACDISRSISKRPRLILIALWDLLPALFTGPAAPRSGWVNAERVSFLPIRAVSMFLAPRFLICNGFSLFLAHSYTCACEGIGNTERTSSQVIGRNLASWKSDLAENFPTSRLAKRDGARKKFDRIERVAPATLKVDYHEKKKKWVCIWSCEVFSFADLGMINLAKEKSRPPKFRYTLWDFFRF